MPKPMYVWTGSAWVSVASEVESLANYATQSYADNQPGMKMIIPTSVAVGSGSGSVSTNGAVTFSGASSVSVNGCFNSSYDNYRIIFSNLSNSADANCNLRLRKSGTDNSSNIYYRQYLFVSSTSVSAAQVQSTAWEFTSANSTTNKSAEVELSNPNAASIMTTGIADSRPNGSNTVPTMYQNVLVHNLASSADFDGFTFYPASGNATGTIRIYGYKNG